MGSEQADFIRSRVELLYGHKDATVCECEHNIKDTGGIFLYSVGLIKCTICDGWQVIRKVGI